MDERRLFRDLVRANYHRGGITCLRVSRLDAGFFAALQHEVETLVQKYSPSEVAKEAHVTNWTRPFGTAVQFSLLNRSGRFDDTSADHDGSVLNKTFHHGAEFPHLARFIGTFTHAMNFRLNGMGQKSGLSPHEEHVVHYLDTKGWSRTCYLRARFHLPIMTNPGARMLLGREIYHFDEGFIYYFNNGAIHSAENLGDRLRLHLVWDMLLTKETYRQMFAGELPADIFTSLPPADQIVMPIDTIRVDRYETSGPGKQLYDRMRLNRFGIQPYQFQNLYNWFEYLRPKRVRFADVR